MIFGKIHTEIPLIMAASQWKAELVEWLEVKVFRVAAHHLFFSYACAHIPLKSPDIRVGKSFLLECLIPASFWLMCLSCSVCTGIAALEVQKTPDATLFTGRCNAIEQESFKWSHLCAAFHSCILSMYTRTVDFFISVFTWTLYLTA